MASIGGREGVPVVGEPSPTRRRRGRRRPRPEADPLLLRLEPKAAVVVAQAAEAAGGLGGDLGEVVVRRALDDDVGRLTAAARPGLAGLVTVLDDEVVRRHAVGAATDGS
jgi:hypothetical protein